MIESKTRLIAPALLLAFGAALVGCSASKDGPKYPQPLPSTAIAKFDIASGALPYPIDLYFSPSASAPLSDGTLNLPTVPFRSAGTQAALNAIDGWSTTATLDTSFSIPLDASSIGDSTVKIIKIWVNPSNKGPVDPSDPVQAALFLPDGATSPVAGILQYGDDKDFVADLDDAYDAGGKILRITPKKPLDFSRGPAALNANKVLNVGYIVVLTNGLKATTGEAMGSDALYSTLKSTADCSTLTDPTQKKLCPLVKAQLGIAQAVGINPSSVILTWSFSTQSIDDTLDVISLASQPATPLIVPTGKKTSDVSDQLAGHADIFVGAIQLPYYLTAPAVGATLADTKAAVLSSYWKAATGPNPLFGLDPDSRNLTMFNPVPAPTGTVTVPILVTVPNANSGCTTGMPTGGWPVAIVQHGITGDRSQALAMADAFADACFIVAAMDLPLHGITDTASPLYCTPDKPGCFGARERTFDVDFANNDTGASVPDGKIDKSGSYFINLTSLLTQRDNLREAEADLILLTKSLPNLSIYQGQTVPPASAGVNPARISFVGLSLGAIVGGSHVHFSNDTRTATLAAPGGVLTRLLLDSDTFGPIIRAGINSAGATPGSYVAELFIRDAQAVIDSGDPINHIKDAGQMHPLHLMKVLNDTVVPNSATDRLIVAGGLTKLTTLGANPVGPGTPAYTFFSKGYHGSLFDPTVTSPETTVEMQKEAVKFAASAVLPGGPFVILEDATVLDLN